MLYRRIPSSISKALTLVVLALLILTSVPAQATVKLTTPKNQIIDAANKQQDAFDAALDVSTPGPAIISLGDQGILDLPENYFYIPPKQAQNLLQTLGNKTGPEFLGLIIPKEHLHWFITIDFMKSGFINDTDAKFWNSETLLDEIRKSTAEENLQRAQQSLPTLQIDDWLEAPVYDNASRRLTWSVLGKYQNDNSDNNHQSINYNTYILGREGYLNLTLITSHAALIDDKVNALNIAAAIHYNPGKRYADFNKKTDIRAAYSLTTLITGRQEKTPVIAMTIYVAQKGWKIVLMGLVILLLMTIGLPRTKLKPAPELVPDEK
jgi:uncharacterized membrane-anchored protein